MSTMPKPRYRFGDFELDPDERRLLALGEPVALTPKVFDTLVLLVERAGHAVSKDELMQALWPRGFVDESNLIKHIWLIRKALGDSEHSRFVETVPKLGYRFVAPVRCIALAESAPETRIGDALKAVMTLSTDDVAGVAADRATGLVTPLADAGLDHPLAVDERRPGTQSRPRRWLAAALVMLALAAVVTLSLRNKQAPLAADNATAGSFVAIVQFDNMSQNAKDAWLGPALAEMLATEIASTDLVHAVPDELVRPARADLPIPLAGGYAAPSLTLLRQRVGADFVLSGGYLVSGTDDQARVRVDLALQDARNDTTLARFAREGSLAGLSALVVAAGADLREHLGVPAASNAQLQQLAAAQPPTAEVARRLGFALDALHRNDPARARDELLDAVAQAPGYAPAYSYLSQAWSALGYKAKALAAAQQAASHAQDLPQEQRLQIDLQVSMQQHDWPAAIERARALVALRPGNPEYRFRLTSALIAGGKPDLAQAELDAMKQDESAGDPRLELERARVAAARNDSPAQATHAERALQQARQRDEIGVAAEAAAQLGIARWRAGDTAAAEQVLKQARSDYVHIGNPHGVAWVDQNLGNAFVDGDPNRAREYYQRAMSGYQGIGDRSGEAAIYSDLAIMLWGSGDRDGAETAVRKSLAIRRETADLVGEAWNLTALAGIEMDSNASDAVDAEYREAIALDEQAGERLHRAFALTQYSDLQRMRGDLKAAQATCAQGEHGFQSLHSSEDVAGAQIECAGIALDQGKPDEALAAARRLLSGGALSNNPILVLNAEVMQAQVAIGRGHCDQAIPHLEAAIKTGVSGELVSGEAFAQAELALCQHQLGHDAASAAAAARARALRSRVTVQQEVFGVDLALAQLDAVSGQHGARARLEQLIADADKRHWFAWSLESRLALVQLLELQRDPSARARREALDNDARAKGFGWIIERLHSGVPAT